MLKKQKRGRRLRTDDLEGLSKKPLMPMTEGKSSVRLSEKVLLLQDGVDDDDSLSTSSSPWKEDEVPDSYGHYLTNPDISSAASVLARVSFEWRLSWSVPLQVEEREANCGMCQRFCLGHPKVPGQGHSSVGPELELHFRSALGGLLKAGLAQLAEGLHFSLVREDRGRALFQVQHVKLLTLTDDRFTFLVL
jgi:hypothetical protein